MTKLIDTFFGNCAVLCVRFYRLITAFMPKRCRFYPSCSEYSISAFGKYGFLKGFYFTFVRIIKCHPFHPGGVDELR